MRVHGLGMAALAAAFIVSAPPSSGIGGLPCDHIAAAGATPVAVEGKPSWAQVAGGSAWIATDARLVQLDGVTGDKVGTTALPGRVCAGMGTGARFAVDRHLRQSGDHARRHGDRGGASHDPNGHPDVAAGPFGGVAGGGQRLGAHRRQRSAARAHRSGHQRRGRPLPGGRGVVVAAGRPRRGVGSPTVTKRSGSPHRKSCCLCWELRTRKHAPG